LHQGAWVITRVGQYGVHECPTYALPKYGVPKVQPAIPQHGPVQLHIQASDVGGAEYLLAINGQ